MKNVIALILLFMTMVFGSLVYAQTTTNPTVNSHKLYPPVTLLDTTTGSEKSLSSTITGAANTGYGGYFANPSGTGYALGINGAMSYSPSGNGNLQRMLGGTAQLPHWNKALTNVLFKQGNARILCIGDSVTEGYYSLNTGNISGDQSRGAFCNQLVNMFNSAGLPASNNNYIGSAANDRYLIDARVTKAPNWVTTGTNGLGGNFLLNTSTGSFSLASTTPIDTVKIWYPRLVGGGSFKYNVDGGSDTTVSQSGASAYLSSTTSYALGSHTINIAYASGASGIFNSIEAWDSTKSQVMIENAGWSGTGSTEWSATTNPWDTATACGTFAPDLVIIMLQNRDMALGTSFSTVNSQMNTLISNCRSGGNTDVLIATGIHTNPSDTTTPISEATQALYSQNMRSLAASTSNSQYVMGVPVVDEAANFVSWNLENSTLGMMYLAGTYPQDLHPNWVGHELIARDIFQTLMPVGIGGNYNQGTVGKGGTFVCTSGGTITVANTTVQLISNIIISLNTAGGTVSTAPTVKTLTPTTGFTVLCPTLDTSTYNYIVLN